MNGTVHVNELAYQYSTVRFRRWTRQTVTKTMNFSGDGFQNIARNALYFSTVFIETFSRMLTWGQCHPWVSNILFGSSFLTGQGCYSQGDESSAGARILWDDERSDFPTAVSFHGQVAVTHFQVGFFFAINFAVFCRTSSAVIVLAHYLSSSVFWILLWILTSLILFCSFSSLSISLLLLKGKPSRGLLPRKKK